MDYICILKSILSTLQMNQNKISPPVEFIFKVKVEKIVLKTLDTFSSGQLNLTAPIGGWPLVQVGCQYKSI